MTVNLPLERMGSVGKSKKKNNGCIEKEYSCPHNTGFEGRGRLDRRKKILSRDSHELTGPELKRESVGPGAFKKAKSAVFRLVDWDYLGGKNRGLPLITLKGGSLADPLRGVWEEKDLTYRKGGGWGGGKT